MQQITLDINHSENSIKQQTQKRSMNNSNDDLSYSSMNAAPIPKKSAIIKTSKPRPHVCSTCTRAFARLEHLKRHERSHTNEKPFQCAACGRCFARRDLVLRHQQKLHASLPTNNRSNIQRKGRSQKVIPKDGEIVPDYLNDNINIVRNNTSAKLPLPNKLNDVNLNNNSNDNSNDNTNSNPNSNSYSSNTPSTDNSSISRNNSSHTQPSLQNQTVFNSSLLGANVYNSPPSAGFTMSPNLFGLNQSKQQQAQHPQSQQQQQQQQQHHFETISPISQQQQNQQHIQSKPFDNQASNNRHDELNSDELDSDIDFDIHQFDTPQAMYSNDLYENTSNQGNFRNHRHASFSAAASGSYTGFPDSTHEQDKMLTQIENEAPQQVRFSSPQLKHQSNGDFTYLDMDLLDNLDLDNLNDLGIDFNAINTSMNQQQQQQQLKKEQQQPQQHHQQHQQLPRSSLFNNNTKSLFNFKTPALNTLNNNDLQKVVPNPQTEATLQRVLSHPQSDATIQRVLSHPHSEVALQKVLSHPQSEVALQKVFSHPQPEVALQSVLSHPSDTDWFNEFINAPIETDFPIITDHIGFTDASKNNDSSTTPSPSKFQNVTSPSNDLSQFFRLRQIDLSKHIPHHHENPTIPGRCSENVRQHVINKYHLKLSQFPQLDDLNHYLALYETEFNKYFPFIHIPSLNIEEKYDQIPLLLSMAAIGALYSFHARNSSTLFNFSRFLIHNFMENQMNLNHFNDIPLYITQALLLHMFLGMFHNDAEVTKLTARQLTSLVSLVKTTKLDMPLETIILPPSITSDLVLSSSNANSKFLKSCHDYFILSQSRIRTVHVLHYLCVLFSCLTDTNVELTAENIRCGSPCTIEELWKAKSCNEWLNILQDHKITIDSKFSLIRVSNGTNTYRDLWRDLTNLSLDKDVGLRGLLSLLLSLNGFIHKESKDLEASNKTEGAKIAQWRMDERPYIESLIKIWESCFIRNGGVLVPRGQNLHAINRSCVLKLILPLLSFAKINKCVYLSTVLSKVWISDWEGMNVEIKKLTRDMEALRDSINYSLDIINLWIEIISITNDAEKTSVRTPIFFLTCLFTSTLLISEYLYTTEVWANNYLTMPDKFTELTTADRVLWLRAETVFKKVEKNLLPSGSNNSSYSEFLRIQAKGALDVDILDDEIARLALEPGDLKPIAEIIISGRLSSRCLGLGVRILADAPVWPVALVFAEALKARATHIHNCTSSWSPMTKISPK